MLVFDVTVGPLKGRRFHLTPDRAHVLIGRRHGSVRLEDPKVSRTHAEFVWLDGRWQINDLNSTNGTYINAKMVSERTVLNQGDFVQVGSSLLYIAQADREDDGSTLGETPSDLENLDDQDQSPEEPDNEDTMVDRDGEKPKATPPDMPPLPLPPGEYFGAARPNSSVSPIAWVLMAVTAITLIALLIDAMLHPG